MENRFKLRMYGLVPYQLSGTIHAGIQFGHAVVEYAQSHFTQGDYQMWAKHDKTFIILNGGTSSTMVDNQRLLNEARITTGSFFEPDLNDMLSGIVFLVDERVYDKETYPDFKTWMIKRNPNNELIPLQTTQTLIDTFQRSYEEWSEIIGGEKNVFLKQFLTNFKLA